MLCFLSRTSYYNIKTIVPIVMRMFYAILCVRSFRFSRLIRKSIVWTWKSNTFKCRSLTQDHWNCSGFCEICHFQDKQLCLYKMCDVVLLNLTNFQYELAHSKNIAIVFVSCRFVWITLDHRPLFFIRVVTVIFMLLFSIQNCLSIINFRAPKCVNVLKPTSKLFEHNYLKPSNVVIFGWLNR